MKPQDHLSLSILLPVYNAPHHVRDLFKTLARHTNPKLIEELIIGDDASDMFTQSVLEEISHNMPFKVRIVRNAKNVGYLNNVNKLYEAAKTELCVVLNTDTLVPQKWLERIRDAFEKNDTAVLATPFSTNATNLTILPTEGQSWLDIDYYLSSQPPQYPDAHTAVGFCLAVRKSLLKEKFLLDTAYQFGYWEETDLHYRALSKGLRSIVIDNLLVYHARGSSSFSLKHNLSKVSNKNKKIFDSKWNKTHIAHEIAYQKNKPYDYLKTNYRLNYVETNQAINVLFVLPAFIRGSGGVQLVINLVEQLNLSGIRASLFVYGHIDEDYVNFLATINPWRSFEAIYNNVSSVDIIFATSYDSVKYTRNLADHYDAKLAYFVQGPEALFLCGKNFGQVVTDYQTMPSIITVSSFLKNYLAQLSVSDTFSIPMGCDTYKFYTSETYGKRNIKSIAACLRLGDTKGTGILLHALAIAKKAGFDIHFFGKTSYEFNLPAELGYYHGDLLPHEICKLFNQVGYYLDLSYFEGLGLLPLEAANCGAIPIISHNGGADFIFTDKKDAFFIENIFIEHSFFNELFKYNAKTIEEIRKETLKVGIKFSEQLGIKEFMQYLLKHFSNFFVVQPTREFIHIHEKAPVSSFHIKSTTAFIIARNTPWMYKTYENLAVFYKKIFSRKVCPACKKDMPPRAKNKKSLSYRLIHKIFSRYRNEIISLFRKASKQANSEVTDKLNTIQSEILLHRKMLNVLIKKEKDTST